MANRRLTQMTNAIEKEETGNEEEKIRRLSSACEAKA